MASRLDNIFESWQLNDAEFKEAATLTIQQRQLIQTLASEAAQEQISTLPSSELPEEEFLRKLYYNAGFINALKYLLTLNESASAGNIPEVPKAPI